MIHRLVFDTTDATTIAQSSNVGAYLRASDGTLITKTTDGAREAVDVYTELGHAEDVAHSSGDIGIMPLAVRNDVEGSLADADGDYAPLQVDSLGRLRVFADLTVTTSAEKAEDSAHVSGDIGQFMLAVRNDTLGSLVSANGDYAPLQVNADGELYVKTSGTVTVSDAALANTALSAAGESVSVSAALITSVLANRKYVWAYNNGNKVVYIGPSGVSTTSGFPIFPGSMMEARIGAAVAIHAIADSGTQNVRVMQAS